MPQFQDSLLKSKKRKTYLDGLRGFAFLLVIVSHVFGYYFPDWFFNYGKEGVWLFFVLSSFLLSNYFFENTDRTKNLFEWMNYLLRRFLRIYPLFIIVLLMYFSIHYLVPWKISSLLNHIFLVEENGHFWTISVEFKYYLILPFIVLFVVYVLRMNIYLSILLLTISICIHQYFFPELKSIQQINTLITYIPVFITGTAAALIHNHVKNHELRKAIRIPLDIIGIMVIIFFCLSSVNISKNIFPFLDSTKFPWRFTEFGLAFAVLLLCLIHGEQFLKKLFLLKPLVYCGKISYSGYLIHPIILYVTRRFFPNFSIFIIVFMIVSIMIAASILYKYIELPLSKITLDTLISNRSGKFMIRAKEASDR